MVDEGPISFIPARPFVTRVSCTDQGPGFGPPLCDDSLRAKIPITSVEIVTNGVRLNFEICERVNPVDRCGTCVIVPGIRRTSLSKLCGSEFGS